MSSDVERLLEVGTKEKRERHEEASPRKETLIPDKEFDSKRKKGFLIFLLRVFPKLLKLS